MAVALPSWICPIREAYEKYVVASGARYLEGALHLFLPFDFGEIIVEHRRLGGKFGAGVYLRRSEGTVPQSRSITCRRLSAP